LKFGLGWEFVGVWEAGGGTETLALPARRLPISSVMELVEPSEKTEKLLAALAGA